MYNEEEVIDLFFKEVCKVVDKLNYEIEFICVNDGSTDNTLAGLIFHSDLDSRVKIINFSRNFGKEAAISAALDFAGGDAVLPIDCDLQDPPDLIPVMLKEWDNGYDVVCARRGCRKSDSFLKRVSAKLFYRANGILSDIDIPENVGDFRVISRRVVDVIVNLPEKNRFMKGLYSWPGYKTTYIDYVREERVAGKSKFNYWKLWNFALDGITSFSSFPIRMATYIGLPVIIASFLYAFYLIFKTLIFGVDVPGYASIMVTQLFLGGTILFSIGLLGEYISRIFSEVKNRPIYIVENKYGFED